MKRNIERDKYGKLIKLYGFWVDNNAKTKSCYLDFFEGDEPCIATLHLYGDTVCKISYFHFWKENFINKKVIHTENEIAKFIYKKCRIHARHIKIYIDEFTAENLHLAGTLEDFMTDTELETEDYFLTRESQYNN